MKELEVKFLEIDPKQIQKTIISRGGTPSGEKAISTTYFCHNDMAFDDNTIVFGENATLRLRSYGSVTGEKIVLTIKTPIVGNADSVKAMEETNLVVDSHEAAEAFVRQLGFEQDGKCSLKRRLSYSLSGAAVEIDLFINEEIPPLLEIEAEDVSIIETVAEQLGLDMADAKDWDYFRLKREYQVVAQ